VAREWIVHNGRERPTGNVILAETLNEIHERMLDMRLFRIKRHPDDDPVIVEVWL
jgi:hypothetical protein